MYWAKCGILSLFEKEIKFLLHWTDALFINYCFLLFLLKFGIYGVIKLHGGIFSFWYVGTPSEYYL